MGLSFVGDLRLASCATQPLFLSPDSGDDLDLAQPPHRWLASAAGGSSSGEKDRFGLISLKSREDRRF